MAKHFNLQYNTIIHKTGTIALGLKIHIIHGKAKALPSEVNKTAP